MKLLLALLALVALSTAYDEVHEFKKGDLSKDLQDFLDLVPVDKVIDITVEYMSDDEEFQEAIEYLQSKEFKKLVKEIEGLKEVRKLMKYLDNAGVDIYGLVNKLNEILGIGKIKPGTLAISGGGLHGYVKDILRVLPLKKIEALYKKKLATSKAFADFIDQLKSDNFQKIVNAVYKNPEFKRILKKLKAAGIDLSVVKDLLLAILGITVPDHYLLRN